MIDFLAGVIVLVAASVVTGDEGAQCAIAPLAPPTDCPDEDVECRSRGPPLLVVRVIPADACSRPCPFDPAVPEVSAVTAVP